MTEVADPAATTADQPVEPEVPADTPAAEPEQSPAEANALRRAAEAERKAKRLEDQAKKRDEEEAAKQGEWQKLAEQRETELQQERTERARVEREQRITRLAGRLKFIDTQDAVFRVRGEDGDSDEAALAALEQVAEQSPHLIAKEAPVAPEIGQVLTPSATPDTGPKPPAGKLPLRSQADVEALSDEEFQARYAEVQAVLRSPSQ